MKYTKPLAALALSCLCFAHSSHADVNMGAYVKHDAWSLNTIDQFNADTARNSGAINIFTTFNYSWNQLYHQSRNIVSRGAVPLITLMPYDRNAPGSNVLAEISNGEWDAYIANWIEGFKNWQNSYTGTEKPSMLLRFAHEFNGNWYDWGNKPEDFKAAWRYLHGKFSLAGINDSVGWVWCANNVDVDSYDNITEYYPGEHYVDWLSIDGYNWGSNYSFSRWKSFDETFSDKYVKMVTEFPGKPVMLAEVSTTEPLDVPDPVWGQTGDNSDVLESKEVWVADMLQRIQEDYPAIMSVVWFNTNKELSWALNGDINTGLTAYNNAVVDDYFGGELPIKTSMVPEITALLEEEALLDESEQVAAARPALSAKSSENSAAAKNKDKEDKAAKKLEIQLRLAEIKKALERGQVPKVVGKDILKEEAKGIRKMNKKYLKKWRMQHAGNKFTDFPTY